MDKGYLQLCSVSGLKDIDMSLFPKKLLIVRSVGKATGLIENHGFVHVPQLSPSEQLFNKYCFKWKKNIFTEEEERIVIQGKTNSWWDLYVPLFMEEMDTRSEFIACLNRIMVLLDQGVNVLIVCFCADYSRCHRGLVGYKVSKRGYDVRCK